MTNILEKKLFRFIIPEIWGIMEKPTQELAGFAKTKLLAPGEKRYRDNHICNDRYGIF